MTGVTEITGCVIGGRQVGRRLGFPTANLEADADGDFENGVYAVCVVTEHGTFDGMANIGYRPSFGGGDGKRLLEVNLFGFDGDLYGEFITVRLLKYIRAEKRFDSVAMLKEAVDNDRREIGEFFTQYNRN